VVTRTAVTLWSRWTQQRQAYQGLSSGRATTVPLTAVMIGPERTTTDNATAPSTCAAPPTSQVTTSPNLALQAGDRWSRCIRLTVPDRPIRPLPHIGEPLLNGQECPGHSPFTSTAWAGGLGGGGFESHLPLRCSGPSWGRDRCSFAGPVVRRGLWPSGGRTRPGRSCPHPAAPWPERSARRGTRRRHR
jgi:hypothetical protein